MIRRAVTWGGVVLLVLLASAATGAMSIAALAAAVVVGVSLLRLRGGRPRRVPHPPVVRHVPGCKSGVYTFLLVEVDENGKRGKVVGRKAGKSDNVEWRLSGYVTLGDRLIVGEQVVLTPDHDAVEAQIHEDLRPWRLQGVRARELYRDCPQVRWYLNQLVLRARR